MDMYEEFIKIFKQSEVVKTPQRRLSTFGQTSINYFYLSEIKGFKDRSRLREGFVVAERPKIITPDFFKNRFEGFGKEGSEMGRWISEMYGDSLHGLEYRFRNESKSSHIEHSSLNNLIDQIQQRIKKEESYHSAILQGPDQTWQICLLKFIMDECMASFAVNMKELDEHGFFDTPQKTLKDRRKIIEDLFVKARKNRLLISMLGKKLNDFGLFKEYEDEFFRLIH